MEYIFLVQNWYKIAMVQKIKKRQLLDNQIVTSLWSWWDSNPRPNRETIRFLHAYSGLRFSWRNKTQTTNCALILKNFTRAARHTLAISDLPAPLCPQIRNNILGAMSRSAKPCGGIKLIYYTSIKQRERSCFRQLNFWSLRLRS